MLERSKALQIYFKPGLKEDDVMLRVWQAAKRNARAQEIFRDMLREGLVALVANGTMPESIIEECGLDAIVERRRRRTAKHSDRQAAATPPQPHPVPPYGYPGYPGYPVAAPYPPQEFPGYEQPAPVQMHPEHPAYDQPAPRPVAPPAVMERAVEQPRSEPSAERQSAAQERPAAEPPQTSPEEGRPARKLAKLM
jgi:hypothetical protein